MIDIREGLTRVLASFIDAKEEPFEGNPLAIFMRTDLAQAVWTVVGDLSFKVTGSPGKGRWVDVPWVAAFDPLETTTAQRGVNVSYLFRSDMSGVYLTLGQGATGVREIEGASYRDVLRTRADHYAELLAGDTPRWATKGPVELRWSGDLARGYEAGSILSRFYSADDVPPAGELADDLRSFLRLYSLLLERKDLLAEESSGSLDVEDVLPAVEARRLRWHRRVERNRRLTADAKRYHGTVCVVCGFDFERAYGTVGSGYIEAHHLTPVADLEGRPTQLDPRTDFTVVCANCHRMLHRQNPPLSISELKALVATHMIPVRGYGSAEVM